MAKPVELRRCALYPVLDGFPGFSRLAFIPFGRLVAWHDSDALYLRQGVIPGRVGVCAAEELPLPCSPRRWLRTAVSSPHPVRLHAPRFLPLLGRARRSRAPLLACFLNYGAGGIGRAPPPSVVLVGMLLSPVRNLALNASG